MSGRCIVAGEAASTNKENLINTMSERHCHNSGRHFAHNEDDSTSTGGDKCLLACEHEPSEAGKSSPDPVARVENHEASRHPQKRLELAMCACASAPSYTY